MFSEKEEIQERQWGLWMHFGGKDRTGLRQVLEGDSILFMFEIGLYHVVLAGLKLTIRTSKPRPSQR